MKKETSTLLCAILFIAQTIIFIFWIHPNWDLVKSKKRAYLAFSREIGDLPELEASLTSLKKSIAQSRKQLKPKRKESIRNYVSRIAEVSRSVDPSKLLLKNLPVDSEKYKAGLNILKINELGTQDLFEFLYRLQNTEKRFEIKEIKVFPDIKDQNLVDAVCELVERKTSFSPPAP